MTNRIPSDMAEAMRLTTAGKLTEATALIQRLLGGGGAAAAPAPTTSHPGAPTIIDVEPVTVEVADAPPSRDPPQPAAAPHAGRFHSGPRSGLGETLRDLARRVLPDGLDLGIGGVARPAADPLPDGASFTTASYGNAAGARSYKLYVPANRGGGEPRPLVVMLHGCTQSPDDFAAGTRMNALAEELGLLIAYPEQPSSANANRCWNWFNPDDQRRDHGEPSLIAGITRQIMQEHAVDPTRVYVAGLSAGGAAAVVMGGTYPDLYAGVGVHSGLPHGAARDIPSAFAAMRQGGGRAGRPSGEPVPTIVFHGDRDSTVHPGNGDDVVAQTTAGATGLRTTVERGAVSGGHGYSRTRHADASGHAICEQWTIHGAGHAWAGGSPAGSYTDPRGPDASREMLRFFLANPRRQHSRT
ncbi:PHB depolymerase family esterase [Azospirillum sp. RWY-5-1]|uniref:PHB depolymerase family esterase n=1 Tax=Azospirillum oleiclasticum TaxID=2735135 RepID=A0ABX2TLQ9_9PROT|nr:PHB depolymerase family esterase [Azospirillum oleiclasticum]NYZ15921.1 PHB depolymerase family esterase [Azospirillum oleiclasticum]NYZ23600.1 PHB depolymerase family esterase [Azospirillum oleiclasticum]